MPCGWLSVSFQSLPLFPTSKLALLVLIPRCVGLCTFRTLWASPANSPGRLGIRCCNPSRYLQPEVLRISFPTLDSQSVLLPSWSSWFIHTGMWDFQSTSCCLAVHPLHPGCPSLPLLPVWMNVSSTPWLSDFHIVRFSGSSGFLFLNLLSFFGCARRQSVSTYAFILIGRLLMMYLFEYLLMCLLDKCVSSLKKSLFKSFTHLKIGLFFLFFFSFYRKTDFISNYKVTN